MDLKEMSQVALDVITRFGLRILGALALWIVGRIVISIIGRIIARSLVVNRVDPMLVRYIGSTVSVMLNIVLAIAILGIFGVETTTFAALLAAAGIAIGAAWGGLLANFAAGAFLVVLRPFKTGDFVTVAGITGTVAEVGLFVTSIDTPDNVRTYVGNNKIFSDTIQNYSTNPFRRVDLVAQLHHAVEPADAIRRLKERLGQIPNVMATPPPDVEILSFNLAGPMLAVRPYCHTNHYWQVYFDTNKLIRDTFGAAGYPVPEQHYAFRSPV
ncbi:MAG: mechanosensitive ion channel family protein [Candidatus Rokuibacteriota bacterium]